MSVIINEKEYPTMVRFNRVQDQIKSLEQKELEAKKNLEFFEKSDNQVLRSFWEGQLLVATYFKEKWLEDFKKSN